MADSDLPTKGRQRGVRAVELNVAARLENLALLRTLVGAIGTFEDLDFDAVAGGRGVHPVDSLGLAGCHPAPGGRSAKRRSCGGGFCCLRHPRRGGTGQL